MFGVGNLDLLDTKDEPIGDFLAADAGVCGFDSRMDSSYSIQGSVVLSWHDGVSEHRSTTWYTKPRGWLKSASSGRSILNLAKPKMTEFLFETN